MTAREEPLAHTLGTLRTSFAMVEAMARTLCELVPEAVAASENEEGLVAAINGQRRVMLGIAAMAKGVLAE